MQVARLTLSLALLCAAFASSCACAQESRPQNLPSDSPLSGPPVREPGVPGNSTTFTGNGRREGERVIDHRTFLKALENLRSAPDAALRITPDQDSQIFILFRDLRLAQRAHFEKNLNDLRDVRQVLDIGGDLPPTESTIRKSVDDLRKTIVGEENSANQALSDEAVKQAALEKARRIYESAPRPSAVHVKVWKLLTQAQRDALNDSINTLVAQAESQRREFLSPEAVAEAQMNGQTNGQMNDAMSGNMTGSMNGSMADSMAMRDRARSKAPSEITSAQKPLTPVTNPNDPASLLGIDPAKISPTDPRLPERVRRRIRGMKPALQTEAIARYLVDLKDELAEAQAAASKDKSAAPTIDKVNIPTPEKK